VERGCDAVGVDLCAALDEVEPFACGVHVVETVVGWREDLNGFRADDGCCGEVACPPAVCFDKTKDDAMRC
jgi:hypothetical protein